MKDWVLEIDPGEDIARSRARKDGCSCKGGNCGSTGCGCGHSRPEAMNVAVHALEKDLAYREDTERLYRVIGLMMKQLNSIRGTRN